MLVIIGPAKEDLEFLWKFQVSKPNFIVAESQDTQPLQDYEMDSSSVIFQYMFFNGLLLNVFHPYHRRISSFWKRPQINMIEFFFMVISNRNPWIFSVPTRILNIQVPVIL